MKLCVFVERVNEIRSKLERKSFQNGCKLRRPLSSPKSAWILFPSSYQHLHQQHSLLLVHLLLLSHLHLHHNLVLRLQPLQLQLRLLLIAQL
jgi:hypothetical protein